ncbi:amino acid ABC transporter substrate-binding protein [Herbaspirillum sp.]|uniref:amino acid ABC transporter substrate-binding protein n=1 Tax=Herbaspirillum sp. TaxID=1890675 RepID=UPI001B01BFDF|nr:amino acid ABC transporter substrate-binding protein [Herbaspirillum sp.]MBO9538724.1 amino acid ABC transporter substrate-binding protein [Herbaspirillum sp.]
MVRARARTGGADAVRCAKLSMAVLACLCLAPLSAHAESTLDKIRRTGTMVIAYPASHFPFAEADGDGKAAGYSIEICRKIADAVRRETRLSQLQVRYLQVDVDGRFEAISSGAADIECGSTTSNASRRSRFDFTIPHFYTTTRMLVRKDSGIRSWLDMRGKRMVTLRGSAVLPYVKARDAAGVLGMRWIETATDADAMAMVADGRADAYADDDVLLYSYRTDMKNPDSLEIVGEALSVDPYAMMMRKDDAAFKAVVDREMARMIFDGEIYGMYDRWFMRPAGARKRTLNLPMGYVLRDSFRFPSDKITQ